MKTPFFSIIIPVYNVQAYIARCLDSIVNQTFRDIEIIIVDDCGSDRSIEIAKSYASKDPRIKIIHNPCNLGLLNARIQGEKQACGEYIFHVDSDDFIKLETCEKIYKILMDDQQKNGNLADICCFSAIYHLRFLSIRRKIWFKTLNNNQILYDFFLKRSNPNVSIWNKIYKKSLSNKVNLFFQNTPHITLSEDVLKTFLILSYSQRVIGTKEAFYHYAYNPLSATRHNAEKTKNKRISDLQYSISFFQNLANQNITNSSYFQKSCLKIQKILMGAIELEYRFTKECFAYPKACFKSLILHKEWTLYVRLTAYFISFGLIKL